MKLRSIDDINVKGKYVLLRDDFNVQIVDGQITDAFRINQSLITINKLRSAGARVVICSHLGRPNGKFVPDMSLKIVAEYMNIDFISDCLNRDFLPDMHDGDVVLLENLRFYKGEEENDEAFAKKLAVGMDVFVNDAFAVSHRAAASTVGITNVLPSYAGDLLQAEVSNISAVMEKPERPLIAMAGGSKVSTKIGVMKNLCKIADKIIVGGALGTTFLYAQGYCVGNSLYEADQKDAALDILDFAKRNNCEILLPIDKGVANTFSRTAIRYNRDIKSIRPDDVIMDDGLNTTARNIDIIKGARTIIWNGTFGMAEWGNVWGYSTFNIARAVAEQSVSGALISVVGGGDTVAALDAIGVQNDMGYVSTGGGAFLEFLEGRELPALCVLVE